MDITNQEAKVILSMIGDIAVDTLNSQKADIISRLYKAAESAKPPTAKLTLRLGTSKVDAIVALRTLSGCTLKEAKDLVDSGDVDPTFVVWEGSPEIIRSTDEYQRSTARKPLNTLFNITYTS